MPCLTVVDLHLTCLVWFVYNSLAVYHLTVGYELVVRDQYQLYLAQ